MMIVEIKHNFLLQLFQFEGDISELINRYSVYGDMVRLKMKLLDRLTWSPWLTRSQQYDVKMTKETRVITDRPTVSINSPY